MNMYFVSLKKYNGLYSVQKLIMASNVMKKEINIFNLCIKKIFYFSNVK